MKDHILQPLKEQQHFISNIEKSLRHNFEDIGFKYLFQSILPKEFFSAQSTTASLNFMNMLLFDAVGVVGSVSIRTNC